MSLRRLVESRLAGQKVEWAFLNPKFVGVRRCPLRRLASVSYGYNELLTLKLNLFCGSAHKAEPSLLICQAKVGHSDK